MAEQGRDEGEGRRLHGFLGVFDRAVDAKGRFSLPFPFRHAEQPADERWVLVPGPDGTLCLYPDLEWKRALDRRARRRLETAERDELRTLSAQCHPVRPDGQGRITLTQPAMGRHEITETVTVVGMNHYLELWSPERLAAKKIGEREPSEDLLTDLFA